jgi:hypothetical protein
MRKKEKKTEDVAVSNLNTINEDQKDKIEKHLMGLLSGKLSPSDRYQEKLVELQKRMVIDNSAVNSTIEETQNRLNRLVESRTKILGIHDQAIEDLRTDIAKEIESNSKNSDKSTTRNRSNVTSCSPNYRHTIWRA